MSERDSQFYQGLFVGLVTGIVITLFTMVLWY